MGQLGVGPSNTSLGTATASILDRTATTGATSVYIGSDNNGHTSATTTNLTVLEGASQGAADPFDIQISPSTNAFSVSNGGTGTFHQGVIISSSNTFANTGGGYLFANATYNSTAGNIRLVGATAATTAVNIGGDSASFPSLAITSQVNPIINIVAATGASTAQLAVPGTQATGTGDVNVCWTTAGKFTEGSVCGTSLAIYKQNIQPVEHGLDYVMRMRPVTFDWKKDGKSDLGLIADEVAAIDPLMGAYRANGDLYNFKDRAVLATLIKAVQEIETQIQGLKARQ
jgi:hypothetical protein